MSESYKEAKDKLPDMLTIKEMSYYTGFTVRSFTNWIKEYPEYFRPISGVGKHRFKFYKKESLIKFIKNVKSSNAHWKGWQNL
jgi:cation diffusion facilitator CzcD-associated flavoprotein CzcO